MGIRKSLIEFANGDCVFSITRAADAGFTSPAPAVPHVAVLGVESATPAAWEQIAQRCPGCNRGRRSAVGENRCPVVNVCPLVAGRGCPAIILTYNSKGYGHRLSNTRRTIYSPAGQTACRAIGRACAAEDIEFVHRARVATRRLRAALRMFDGCFAPKRIKRWQKAIRQTTSALGDARDRDVQIEWLCGTLSALTAKECFPGVARVLVQLERDRERLQRKVVKAVERLEAKGILRKCGGWPNRVLVAQSPSAVPVDFAQPEAAAPPQPDPEAIERVKQHVLRQLHEFLEQQDSLANPEDHDRHHAMRIAAKRLRYTLEISRAVHPGRLDAAVEAIKKVQTLLGDVHDCDVWLDHLDAFAGPNESGSSPCLGTPAGSNGCCPASSICKTTSASFVG